MLTGEVQCGFRTIKYQFYFFVTLGMVCLAAVIFWDMVKQYAFKCWANNRGVDQGCA